MVATSEEAKARKRAADRARIAARRAAARAATAAPVAADEPATTPEPARPTNGRESGAHDSDAATSEVSSQSPPGGSRESSSEGWPSVEDGPTRPRFMSEPGRDPAALAEFLSGAGALRLHGAAAKVGVSLTPQNFVVAGVLAAGHESNAVSMPRRSSKTTSIFAVGLGRMMHREGYQFAYAMTTTAVKARERFLTDVVAPIERQWPDPDSSPWKVVRANGREQLIYKETGSRLAILTPKGEAFRSDAWDLIVIDEGGEADVELGEDLIAGALATMDTRPEPQLVIAGTAAKFRDGQLLWKALEEGRAGKGGIVEYAADQDTAPEDADTWEQAEALLRENHPGVGTLTTIERMRSRWEKLPRRAWLAEYVGVFGSVGATAFLNQKAWADARRDGDLPAPPEHFVIGFQVHPDSTVATLVATWRDTDGRACLLVLWHGPVRGLNMKALELGRRYRMPVGYDSGNAATDSEAQRLSKARPAIRLTPQKWADVSTAAALLTREIESGNVVHWGQTELDEAVAIATKRGTRESKRWAFGRPEDESDITPLEAAALALRLYDENPPRAGLRAVAAT